MVETLNDIVSFYPEITGIHPACVAVPEISTEDMTGLCESVASKGLQDEIVLTKEGLLVDGRNRLVACYRGQIEPRFKRSSVDPWQIAEDKNINRRHLTTGQKSMFGAKKKEFFNAEAKERQGVTQFGSTVVVTLPPPDETSKLWAADQARQAGKSRDKAAASVGVSGSSIDKAVKILAEAPDIAAAVSSGGITLEAGYTEVKKREAEKKTLPTESSIPEPSIEMTNIVTAAGVVSQIALPKKTVFNKTTDAVDWARWTWNPVTGCEHGCTFCYAREIANSKRMSAVYPNGFEPTFHEYRLDAPKNTNKPDTDDSRDGRVFVCSMADLFGKWVPDNWVKAVFDSCLKSPEWEYLFLTKWPARYSQMPLIPAAWYGASVIKQSDVKRIESAMQKITDDSVTRWVSLEPMLEPIKFNDLSWCDLVVIGSQTSTTQSDGYVAEFAPEFDWVVDVVNQCRAAGVPYYLKANLGMDRPGMNLPKSNPR